MAKSNVARPYAQALLELAREGRVMDRVAADIKHFAGHLDNPELHRALCTPLFGMGERTVVLEKLLARLQYAPLTSNFLRTLNEKGRLPDLRDIANAFEELVDEAAGRVRVSVATAEPMTPQIESEVRATLERSIGKTIVLTSRVEPALIGGMVATVGNKVYDSSIRTRLEQLRMSLLQAQMPGQA